MTRLQVEAVVVGRKRAGSPERELTVAMAAEPNTLRSLIEAIVRSEVEAFRARSEDQRLVHVLTEVAIVEGLDAGAIRSGERGGVIDLDADQAVATALQAQRDGLFQTFVDDRPVDDLDTLIDVSDGTRVLFLRLVPLVGG